MFLERDTAFCVSEYACDTFLHSAPVPPYAA